MPHAYCSYIIGIAPCPPLDSAVLCAHAWPPITAVVSIATKNDLFLILSTPRLKALDHALSALSVPSALNVPIELTVVNAPDAPLASWR